MGERFFGRQIEVATGGEVKEPVTFRLEGRQYTVIEILESWPDYGFGRDTSRRKHWWQRHHRNYYRVLTAEGEVYEMYYDRGVSLSHPERRKWYLTRRW